MNILILTAQGPGSRSGVRIYAEIIARNLKQRGCCVEIRGPADAPCLARKFFSIVARCLRVVSADLHEIWAQLRTYGETYAFCRKSSDPDLVHAQDAITGSAAQAAFRHKVPVLVTCHFNESPVTEAIKQRDLGKLAERFLTWWFDLHFKRLDQFICVSNYLAECTKPWVRSDATIKVIHNGVPFADIPEEPFLWGRDKRIVINVGHIEPRKNQLFLVEVARLLKKENIEFWFLGDGFGRADLEEKIDLYALRDSVKILGWQENVPSYFHQADLCVHVAKQECFGLAVVEAMLNRCPVVAFGVGGVPELFSDECQNSLVPADSSPEAVAKKISKLFSDEGELKEMCNQQLAFARQYFTEQVMMEQVVNMYSALLPD